MIVTIRIILYALIDYNYSFYHHICFEYNKIIKINYTEYKITKSTVASFQFFLDCGKHFVMLH